MTSPRLAYDDASTTSEMVTDATRLGLALPVPAARRGTQAGGAALPGLVVSDDLAALAGDLELHLA